MALRASENGIKKEFFTKTGKLKASAVVGGGGGGGTSDHSQLTNRNKDNQHPISAITNLQSSLDNLTNAISLAMDTINEVESEIPTKLSELTNDSGYITDVDIITNSTSSTVVFEMANNTDYRFTTELASCEFTFPTMTDNYISLLTFKSGATATSLTYPQGILWTGDDISVGEFVPISDKKYTVIIWYDGISVNGIVRGVEQ